MRLVLSLAVCCICSNFDSLFADVFVRGHWRKNGTYVQPYHRTASDGNVFNNYSTKGNYNPWTLEEGHVDPDPYRVETHHNYNRVYQTDSNPHRNLETSPYGGYQKLGHFFETVWD